MRVSRLLVACVLVISLAVLTASAAWADEGLHATTQASATQADAIDSFVPDIAGANGAGAVSSSSAWTGLSQFTVTPTRDISLGLGVPVGGSKVASGTPVDSGEVFELSLGTQLAPLDGGITPPMANPRGLEGASVTIQPAKPTSVASTPSASIAAGQGTPQLIMLGGVEDKLQPARLPAFDSNTLLNSSTDAERHVWTRGGASR